MGVQIALQDSSFNYFGYISRSRVAGFYARSLYNFLRNFHTVFHNACTFLHSQHQYTRVPISSHLYLLSSAFFLTVTILTIWSGISLWFWFSLPIIISMLSVFYIYVGYYLPSLEKCLFKSFAHFLIGLFGFLLLSCRNSLYILNINPLSNIWFTNIFSHQHLFTLLTISFAV